MTSRLLNGVMPFTAGRDHLHHRLVSVGIKPKKILLIMVFISAFLALIGFLIELNFPKKEYVSFYAFLALSIFYFILSKGSIKNSV